jgi:hypothetical protein
MDITPSPSASTSEAASTAREGAETTAILRRFPGIPHA